MTTLSKSFDLATLTPRERKSYQNGLAVIASKLRGNHRLTAAEREAACLAAGLQIVRKTLSTARAAKTMAAPAPATKSPAPAGRKTFSAPGPKTRHRYTMPGGLFGP
ncbi:MAG: hypothetical protein WCO57_17235 [Verrucomicrobiota bacterium]